MSKLTLPLWIDLTPTGKTLVLIYPCGHRENISEALIDQLGEPEAEGALLTERGTYHILPDYQTPREPIEGPAYFSDGTYYMLFPHQNLPERLMDLAERMTSQTIIEVLEQNIPITDNEPRGEL